MGNHRRQLKRRDRFVPNKYQLCSACRGDGLQALELGHVSCAGLVPSTDLKEAHRFLRKENKEYWFLCLWNYVGLQACGAGLLGAPARLPEAWPAAGRAAKEMSHRVGWRRGLVCASATRP